MRSVATALAGVLLGALFFGLVGLGLMPLGAQLALGVALLLVLLLAGRPGLSLAMLGGFVLMAALTMLMWSMADNCATERPDGTLVEYECSQGPR